MRDLLPFTPMSTQPGMILRLRELLTPSALVARATSHPAADAHISGETQKSTRTSRPFDQW